MSGNLQPTELNLPSLRKDAFAVFSDPGFCHILWAGVFGSVSRGEQKRSSDVDVVVIWDPDHPAGWVQQDKNVPYVYLEEALHEAWAREIDVVEIEGGELLLYVDVEALVSARTIYGNDNDDRVQRIKGAAWQYLETNRNLFVATGRQILETRALLEGKSFEVFAKLSWCIQGAAVLTCLTTRTSSVR